MRPRPSEGELRALWASLADCDPVLAWAVRVALFSGMRQGEILGLRPQDIRTVDGVHVFDVCEYPGRTLKNARAVRLVPVHSALADLPPEVFAGGRGPTLSQSFARHLQRIGIRPRLTFHSLRRMTSTALETAGVAENVAAEILGHRKQTLSYGLYSGGAGLSVLADAIERIKYFSCNR